MYVIKGFKDGTPIYYASAGFIEKWNLDVDKFDEIDKAIIFDTNDKAEEVAYRLRNIYDKWNIKIYPICPICHKDYSNYPAISRKDNKSKICPQCGTAEALIEFMKQKKSINDFFYDIKSLMALTILLYSLISVSIFPILIYE